MLYNDAAGIFITCTRRTRIDTSVLLISWSNHKIFFHFFQKKLLHIFLLPDQASTLALSFEPVHISPPLQTKKNPSACTEHITRKSVTAWQVIAPNGCQPAEMWGGHCEKRSETRGERPSLILALSPSVSLGSEPDLTSKSSQDMNSLWELILSRLTQCKPAPCLKSMHTKKKITGTGTASESTWMIVWSYQSQDVYSENGSGHHWWLSCDGGAHRVRLKKIKINRVLDLRSASPLHWT